jgi:hypothetical protein
MDGFTKVMSLAGLALLAIIVIAVFWVGILYYAALALAIVFFPLIIAMCGGYGITGDDSSEQHG